MAAGPWCETILKQGASTSHFNFPVSPLKGEILRYDLGDEPPVPVSLWWGSDYASSKPDGLLHVGATHSDAGFDEEPSRVGKDEIRRSAERALPFLSTRLVSKHTACLRPVTPDGLPIVGELESVKGLVAATGGGPIGIELGHLDQRQQRNVDKSANAQRHSDNREDERPVWHSIKHRQSSRSAPIPPCSP